ncbi:MAG: nitronate monooxygenase [Gracilibacteraceae bacterium]|jgi:NAD(P)H-dependent flavin oxidoreductase YrpB (nitropropane dioxygenase family)|nr:nitronate monooxygenase [Gracilibacteraceae bacterium]
MPIQTQVTNILKIDHPVVQGAMQWISLPALVASVSEAGGLGVLAAATYPDKEALRTAIRETKSLTPKPFALNVSIFPSLNVPDYHGYFAAALDEGVRIIETSGRAPVEYIDFLKKNGAVVMHKCTTVKHALKAESIGCDLVVIDGFEGGGHPGESDIGSIVLAARAAESLDIPFIACGGFSNGRGLAAALMLGAGAITMGTRFLATKECPILPQIKKFVAGPDCTEHDTMLVMRKYRNTARVYANATAKEALRRENAGKPFGDVASLVSGQRGRKMVFESGDLADGLLSMGLSAGLVHDIIPVRELIERTVREAITVMKKYA